MCESGCDLLIVIGEGIIIGVVVVLKGILEGKGMFALSCEWLGGGPNEAWCSCRERSSRHLEFQLSREQVLVNLP